MELNEIGRNIESIFHQVIAKKEELETEYGWENTDARMTIFNKMGSILSAVNTGYFLMNIYLSDINWWRQFNASVPDRNIKRAFWDFERFFKIGVIQDLFSCVESSFQIYVRTIDPSACSNGTTEFKNIYTWLLNKTNLQGSIPLLDLWRNVRNTMHNNGTFLPSNGKNQTVIYKECSYVFNNGEAISFMTTELILLLIADLLKLVENIVISTPIVSIHDIEELNFSDYPE